MFLELGRHELALIGPSPLTQSPKNGVCPTQPTMGFVTARIPAFFSWLCNCYIRYIAPGRSGNVTNLDRFSTEAAVALIYRLSF